MVIWRSKLAELIARMGCFLTKQIKLIFIDLRKNNIHFVNRFTSRNVSVLAKVKCVIVDVFNVADL